MSVCNDRRLTSMLMRDANNSEVCLYYFDNVAITYFMTAFKQFSVTSLELPLF